MSAQISYFRQFNKLPNTSESHIWADYIEILRFVDQRQQITIVTNGPFVTIEQRELTLNRLILKMD